MIGMAATGPEKIAHLNHLFARARINTQLESSSESRLDTDAENVVIIMKRTNEAFNHISLRIH